VTGAVFWPASADASAPCACSSAACWRSSGSEPCSLARPGQGRIDQQAVEQRQADHGAAHGQAAALLLGAREPEGGGAAAQAWR
jgi:hypothetical protein